MAATTDAAYNAKSRLIECKLDIYFDGSDEEPTSITRIITLSPGTCLRRLVQITVHRLHLSLQMSSPLSWLTLVMCSIR